MSSNAGAVFRLLLIGLGQLASGATGVTTLVDTLRSRISLRSTSGQIWQIVRILHEPSKQIRLTLAGQGKNVNEQPAELPILRIIQPQNSDDFPCVIIGSLETARLVEDDVASEHTSTRVWDEQITLGRVASYASVEKVVVVENSGGVVCLRQEVVEIVLTSDDSPLFSLETINASKKKLV